MVFVECCAPFRSAAGPNWSLLLATGNMQITMLFGKRVLLQPRGPCTSVTRRFGAATKVNGINSGSSEKAGFSRVGSSSPAGQDIRRKGCMLDGLLLHADV